MDKLKRTLKSLETESEDNGKWEQINATSELHSSKDSSECFETSSSRSKSRSSSLIDSSECNDRRPNLYTSNSPGHSSDKTDYQTQSCLSEVMPKISSATSVTSVPNTNHDMEIRRLRSYSSSDGTPVGSFDFSLKLPNTSNTLSSSYSHFPPRPDLSRTQSSDELFSEVPYTPNEPNDDLTSPRTSPRTVYDGFDSFRNNQSPSISILNETLAKTHLQSLQHMNGGGFVSIDLPLNIIKIDEEIIHSTEVCFVINEPQYLYKINCNNYNL